MRLFKNIQMINWFTVVMSITAITVLLLVKSQINRRFRKQLRNIPVPIELIVVTNLLNLSLKI